jgi:hypothetical protein
MRRQVRMKRDRYKILEVIRRQLDVQASEKLTGNDFESFVRLAHFYLAALDVFQHEKPGNSGSSGMSERERQMWQEGAAWERQESLRKKVLAEKQAEVKQADQPQAQPEGGQS